MSHGHILEKAPRTAVTAILAAASSIALGVSLGVVSPLASAQVFQDHTNQAGETWNSPSLWDGDPIDSGTAYINEGDGVSDEYLTFADATPFGGGSLQMDPLGALQLTVSGGTHTVGNSGLIMNGGRVQNTSGGTATLAGNISMTAASTFVSDGQDTIVSGPMTGAGPVIIQTPSGGSVTFTGGNKSFTGGMTISSGSTLVQGAANSLTTGTGNTSIVGTLDLGGLNGFVAAPVTTGTITGGTGGPVELTIGADGIGPKAFAGSITDGSSALSLRKAGDNLQVIQGASSYTGGTLIEKGQIRLNSGASLGTGAIELAGGTATSSLQLNAGTASNTINLNGRSNGSSHLLSVGGGASSLSGPINLLGDAGASPDQFTINALGGNLTITGAVTASGTNPARLNLTGSGPGTISGNIDLESGSSVLNKSGGGTWTLSGILTDVGTINVTSGTLNANSAGVDATNINITGGTFAANNTGVGWTGTATITAPGTFLQGAAGVLDGSKDMIVNGQLNLGGNAGTLAGLVGDANGTVTNGGTLTITDDGSFAGVISGATAINMNGGNAADKQVFTGANTYSGGTVIQNGIISTEGSGTLGTGDVTITGIGSGTWNTNGGTFSNNVTLDGRTSGTAHIDNQGGTTNLTGTVKVDNNPGVNTAPDNYNLVSTAGTLNIQNGLSAGTGPGSDDINVNLLGAGDGTIGAINLGAIGATNDINKSGAGTWSLEGATTNIADININVGTLAFDSAGISYSGTANIASGAVLRQDTAGAFDGKIIQVDGELDLNGMAATLPGLDGLASGEVTNGGLLTVSGGSGTHTFAGDINDGTSLTVNDSDTTQVLSGGGNYTGKTTVSDGVLEIQSDGALGATGVGSGTEVTGTGQLSLDDTLETVETNENLTLDGRDTALNGSQVVSSGGNTILGTVTLSAGTPEAGFRIESTGGVLTVDGDIGHDDSSADVFLELSGNGGGVSAGNVNLAGVDNHVFLEGLGANATSVGGSVDMSGAGGNAEIAKIGAGDMSVTGAINMSNAGVDAAIGNTNAAGTMTIGTAGNTANLSGASGQARLTNTLGGTLNVDGGVNLSGSGSAAVTTIGGVLTVDEGIDMSNTSLGAAIVNAGGNMTLGGVVDMSSSGQTATITNGGAGVTSLNSVVMTTADAVSSGIFQTGSGSTTLAGTMTDVPLASVTDGSIDVLNGSDTGGVAEFYVATGGELDYSDVMTNFHIENGQKLSGNGLLTGDGDTGIVFDAGGILEITESGGDADLDVTGRLAFSSGSIFNITLDLGGTPETDLLNVSGQLAIYGSVFLNVDLLNGISGEPFIFATYGSLLKSGNFVSGSIPYGYKVDYNYGGGNQIALVMQEIPAPAPLALIGLGALLMGGMRKRSKR